MPRKAILASNNRIAQRGNINCKHMPLQSGCLYEAYELPYIYAANDFCCFYMLHSITEQ